MEAFFEFQAKFPTERPVEERSDPLGGLTPQVV
jgi:hypothetical protein